MGAANNINAGYGAVLRTAGWQQTDTGLLWVPPTMKIWGPPATPGGKAPMVPFREGIWIRSFELQNLTAGTINVGIGTRLANPHWQAGLYDGTTYTLATGLQTPVSTEIQVAGADQTGFVILSDRPIDWVSANVTTAETDAGGATVPDHTVGYSTASGFTTITTAMVLTDGFTKTNAVWGVAATNLVWEKQPDWVKTNENHTGLPAGYYALYFTSAQREAGDVAAAVTGLECGEAMLLKGLTTTGIWQIETLDYWMPGADGVVAYFSDNSIANRVYAEVLSR